MLSFKYVCSLCYYAPGVQMLGSVMTPVLASGSAKSANNGDIEFASAGLKRKQLHTEKGDTTPAVQKVCSLFYHLFFFP